MSFFGFGIALNMLKEGKRVSRKGWNGKDQFLEIQVPDEFSKMKKPYIVISPVDNQLVPWVASQTDLLANDWYVVS